MIKLIDILTENDNYSEYSNDALKDMIVNLSRYEGNEELIAAVKRELKRRELAECGDCERQGTDYTHGHDHEASMADGELRDMISNASKLQNMIQPGDELPGWVSAYITLASDYMHSVAEFMQEQQAEMGSVGQEPTPGYAIYEDQIGETEDLPVKYSKGGFPNFFIARIRYSKGSGGVLSVGGSDTATGQDRKIKAIEAKKIGDQIKTKLIAKLGEKLEDITVEDLGNGTVEVFAVSDYFSNLTPSQYEELINLK